MKTPHPFWATCSNIQQPLQEKYIFNLFLLCFVFSVCASEKNLAPASISIPHQVFMHTDKILQSFFFSRLNCPSSLRLSLYLRCCKPLVILLDLHWTCCSIPRSLVLGRPGLDSVLQVCLNREKRSPYMTCR